MECRQGSLICFLFSYTNSVDNCFNKSVLQEIGESWWNYQKLTGTKPPYPEFLFNLRLEGCSEIPNKVSVMNKLKAKYYYYTLPHQYQNSWIQHVHRMSRTRFPRTIFNYRLPGKRSLGRTMKRKKSNTFEFGAAFATKKPSND